MPPEGSIPSRSRSSAPLAYARPGRTVRGTGLILDVLDVLPADRLALRIHDSAFFAMHITARHPRTGDLRSTVKFMVQALAVELQHEPTATKPLGMASQRIWCLGKSSPTEFRNPPLNRLRPRSPLRLFWQQAHSPSTARPRDSIE
ncbi:hypothetical protein ACWD25_05145 [Streptomyces sp. NPDC002920]